ncbi:MAG: TRAM domain-containing protein, partial [Desulfobacterales bacterium]
MEIRKGEIIEVEISDVAFGGNGIAKVDGFVIFVERAIGGDRVAARIIKKKKNHAIARIDTILQPSPHRIPAPCQYSGYCGGCKWQFLSYEKQIEYKRQHVIDSISHIGGMDDIAVHPTLPSEEIFGYRNKMEFSCSEAAWLLPDAFAESEGPKDFAIGLHVPGTYNKVIDIETCHIQPPLGNDILNDIRAFIRDSGLPIYGLRSHIGFWRFVMLRHSVAYDQWMVNIVTAAENPELLGTLADTLVDRYPQITSVVNNVTARKSSVAVGEVEIPLAGASVLREQIGEHVFDIHANSFFQTNTRGARQLYAIV